MVWGEASILKIAPWDRYTNRCMECPSFSPEGTSHRGAQREGAFTFFSPAKKLLVMGQTVMRGPIRVIES